MARVQLWTEAMGQQPMTGTSHRAHGTNKKGLVVAHREVAEDRPFERQQHIREQRCPRRPYPPVHVGELVDLVTRLLTEESGHVHLVLPEEVQTHGRGAHRDTERVVQS